MTEAKKKMVVIRKSDVGFIHKGELRKPSALAFESFWTPAVAVWLQWVGASLCLAVGVLVILASITEKSYYSTVYNWPGIATGVAIAALGPLILRMLLEHAVVAFRIHEALRELTASTDRQTAALDALVKRIDGA